MPVRTRKGLARPWEGARQWARSRGPRRVARRRPPLTGPLDSARPARTASACKPALRSVYVARAEQAGWGGFATSAVPTGCTRPLLGEASDRRDPQGREWWDCAHGAPCRVFSGGRPARALSRAAVGAGLEPKRIFSARSSRNHRRPRGVGGGAGGSATRRNALQADPAWALPSSQALGGFALGRSHLTSPFIYPGGRFRYPPPLYAQCAVRLDGSR